MISQLENVYFHHSFEFQSPQKRCRMMCSASKLETSGPHFRVDFACVLHSGSKIQGENRHLEVDPINCTGGFDWVKPVSVGKRSPRRQWLVLSWLCQRWKALYLDSSTKLLHSPSLLDFSVQRKPRESRGVCVLPLQDFPQNVGCKKYSNSQRKSFFNNNLQQQSSTTKIFSSECSMYFSTEMALKHVLVRFSIKHVP